MQVKTLNKYQGILSSQYNRFKKCSNKYFTLTNVTKEIQYCFLPNCRGGGGGAVIKRFRGKIVANVAQNLQNDPLLQIGTKG